MTLRILLTSETYLPYLSGVTVSVDALARGLGARGHEVMVVAPRPSRGDDPERAGSPGPAPRYSWAPSYALPRIAPPGHRMPWPVPWHAGWREARRFAPDVVHAHSPFVSGVMARGMARSSGAPLVFTHHTRFGDYMHYLGPFAIPGRAVTNAWLRAWWRSCAAIVAPSEDLAASIRAQLEGRQSDAVHVVPTGVDVAGIRSLDPPDVRAMAGWPADAVVVASLGRLAPEKSPVLLVDALGHAARTDPHLHLMVVGGGPLLGRLRERAEATIPGRSWFTGPLPRLEALAAVAGADLFIFTSRSETQGLVLAEALSAGLPAVAIDGPGVRDSVRDGVDGVIVSPTPSGDLLGRLSAALGLLAADPAMRSRLARRASEDADRFDVSRHVERIEAVYHAALGRGTPRVAG